jgi:hypothetical protein
VAPEGGAWDMVALVRYRSRQHFAAMTRDPDYREHAHLRSEALVDAVLQPTVPVVQVGRFDRRPGPRQSRDACALGATAGRAGPGVAREQVVRLAPPGFGAPLPDDFPATVEPYRAWLGGEIEAIVAREGPSTSSGTTGAGTPS